QRSTSRCRAGRAHTAARSLAASHDATQPNRRLGRSPRIRAATQARVAGSTDSRELVIRDKLLTWRNWRPRLSTLSRPTGTLGHKTAVRICRSGQKGTVWVHWIECTDTVPVGDFTRSP